MDSLLNPFTLICMGMLCTGFIYLTWRINKERLIGSIAILLLLITIGGAKLVPVFGHHTNVGNVLYAAAFLATYFLIDRYGTRVGFRSICLSVVVVGFVTCIIKLMVLMNGSPDSAIFNTAFDITYRFAPRLAIASLIAYACAQTINVYIYSQLRAQWDGRYLWLRANLSNAIAQIIDSAIFFSIAFWGMVPHQNIFDIIVTGYLVKVAYMALASPILYANKVEEDDGEAPTVTVTFLR